MNKEYLGDIPLILGSGSPRRKEILEKMGLSFNVIKPDIDDENKFFKLYNINEAIEKLAVAKAQTVACVNKTSAVIGCDTIVALDSEVIGKPMDRDDAKSILQRMSGKEHHVISGVALLHEECGFKQSYVAKTKVYFRDLSERDIELYLDFDEYSDKAGAYAVQGRALTFVRKIDGCFYNVMGLPVEETLKLFNSVRKLSL